MSKAYIVLFLFIIFFSACTQKSAFSVFEEIGSSKIGIDYTKIEHINYKNESRAIINATYLNSLNLDNLDKTFENFLVGIYISEDNIDESKNYMNNPDYNLTLNLKSYKKIAVLDSNNFLYKKIPLLNPYARYYLVSFEKNGSDNLNLEYKHLNFGKVVLNFLAN
jgi:hypothetical protein